MRKPLRSSQRRYATSIFMHPNNESELHLSPPTCFSQHTGSLRWYLTVLLFLAAVALPCAVLYRTASLDDFRPTPYRRVPLVPAVNPIEAIESEPLKSVSEEVRLERVLKAAAMAGNTVILTTLNAAWASPNSVIDLFLESFRVGYHTRRLLDHLVIVGLDQKTFVRCMSIHIHCFALTTKGVDFSGSKEFMSDGYLKMMWRRIDFLRVVLEMGYDFIFTDADIMWFRNPLPYFYPDGDLQIACDHFTGNASDLQNRPNGGFNYVKSSNGTIEFYKFWYSSREMYPRFHDQDVLNVIKYDPYIQKIGLKLKFLNTVNFGGICEPNKDLNKVCTMHANCCIGLGRKLHDLKVMLEDWKTFLSLPPNVKRSQLFSWRVPQKCSLAPLR